MGRDVGTGLFLLPFFPTRERIPGTINQHISVVVLFMLLSGAVCDASTVGVLECLAASIRSYITFRTKA